MAAAVVGVAGWFAPQVIVQTPLRDRPLAMAFAGIDGSITSSAASWRWIGGIEYRDVVLRDRAGKAAVFVPRLALDRGLLRLAVEPRSLGTVRLVDPEVLVEVRSDGSSLEDIVAPWLAATTRPVTLELEIVNGTVELADTVHRVAWRLSDVIAAGTLLADGSLAGWTAAGRLRHSDGAAAVGTTTPPQPPSDQPVRLDRATIPAAAAAVLVRDGGWSMSSPPAAADGGRTITLATHRLPLGGSTVIATRFGLPYLVDGIADLRLDISIDAAGRHVMGDATVERLAVCDAVTLEERLALDHCSLPFDGSLLDGVVQVRRLEASSGAVRAQASGRFRIPNSHGPDWAEELVADDFAASLDVDLAAAATALPGGLAVRPDVRVTGGSLRVAAAARGDGGDRVLELRATARDLAAERSLPKPAEGEGDAAGTRPLSWPEPFTAWIKGRRGPGRGDRLRIEEAKLVSQAVEATAAGSPAAFTLQWQADLGRLMEELSHVLDTGASTAKGTCRGKLDAVADGRGAGAGTLGLAIGFTDVEVAMPGRPVWRDKELAIEIDGQGSMMSGVAAIDSGRAVIAAGEDRLDLSLDGGAVVDLPAVAGFPADASVAWIRPSASATATKAQGSLVGDLARWQPRLAVACPGLVPPDLELAGIVKAGGEAVPQGNGWQWSRAGGEVEKLVARYGGREIVEPRVVVTSAGRVDATSGRIDIASGEVLSTSLSLRTGGLSLLPATAGATIVERLRGRTQWQADVGRVEPWLVPATVAAAWPAAGRGWGTIEIIDTQAGTNLLVEATGSQLSFASVDRPGQAPRPVWSEPRLAGAIEVTRPRLAGGRLADHLVVERLSVESSTLAVASRGRIEEWTSRRIVSLEGSAAYDWQQVSRLLMPWTGGRIRLVGSDSRPFSLRVPLVTAGTVGVAAAAGPAADSLQLPADWLAATRGPTAEPDLAVRVARPASTAVQPLDDRVKALAIDTTASWTGGDIEGFPVAAGELAVRLLEGQLAFGPFDIPVAGGRLRGAPWVRLVPPPGELVIPPGRLVERVALSGPTCQRIATWLSPVLGHAAHASGAMSVDLAGARLPLGDAFGGELAGQVTFENFEVSPTQAVQPLVNLLVKLQSVVDPRFAFGDKAVILRVRPEPVRVRLADRRLAHDGLVMDSGQLVLKSQGSVGQDGSLDMRLEVALRGDLVGQTPVLGTLFRTPLLVPLKGTVQKPQFDAAAMDSILGRIVENTAEAVLKDGIGRGLEAVFGQPPPPAAAPAAPPLVLPPQR